MASELPKMKLPIFSQDLDKTGVIELIKFVDDKAITGSFYKRQNKDSKMISTDWNAGFKLTE